MHTHTSGYRRNTLLSFSAGNLGGHPTRLALVKRTDNVLTRVAYMMRYVYRIIEKKKIEHKHEFDQFGLMQ